eukprot:m.50837 g.50837  ORF g.50837 m.50837 type:complete len:169 (-) comp11193_c0_seq1:12220-12726(-)
MVFDSFLFFWLSCHSQLYHFHITHGHKEKGTVSAIHHAHMRNNNSSYCSRNSAMPICTHLVLFAEHGSVILDTSTCRSMSAYSGTSISPETDARRMSRGTHPTATSHIGLSVAPFDMTSPMRAPSNTKPCALMPLSRQHTGVPSTVCSFHAHTNLSESIDVPVSRAVC